MEVRVLGPLEIVGAGGAVVVGALMQRRLLAALVIHAGQTRSADALIDALWGESPPRSAAKLLQVYVSQLRKILPAGAEIQTHEAGYALALGDEGSLDAVRFERLLAQARDALREGNPALARSLLARALALWRGAAYGELAYEDFARAEADRLEELRLVALEERIEAQLALGQHDELLAELDSLAAEHPLRERLQAQAMLALYRCGRQAEALDLYAAARARLQDDLGLEPGAELRELQRRILQQDPGLAVQPSPVELPSALPSPPNTLLGRERELEELRALLLRDNGRLVVLTGAGGSGKTRLALEAARELSPSFANGAALVGLAPLGDPGLVVAAISQALHVPPVPGQEPLETLARALQPRELLLLLDNVEHLRAAAPSFVELLARAPHLTLLVTSRAVLHLSGEQVYPVEPLRQGAAVELFLARAREADPSFSPDAANEGAIVRICELLDGLPLAIELAASRVRTLSALELLDQLDPRLPLLTAGARDLPARQQTLRSTLEWDYALLDERERRELGRLAVFAGGCTLDAAEAVCATTLDRLCTLLDHSLLRRDDTAHGSRYSMLQTIREFALEKLEEAHEAGEIRRRHALHFLALAQSANLAADAEGEQRHEIVIREQHNIRAALEWSLAEDELELGLELAVALENYWVTNAPLEGKRWLGQLLERAAGLHGELCARALRAYGGTTYIFGEYEDASRHYEASLAEYRRLEDERGIGMLLHRLAVDAFRRHDLAGARALNEESLRIHRKTKNKKLEAQPLSLLAQVELQEGHAELAFELLERSATLCAESGFWWGRAGTLLDLAELLLERGRAAASLARAREALPLLALIGDRQGTIYALSFVARLAAETGHPARAGRLWGAVEAEAARGQVGIWEQDRDELAPDLSADARTQFERGRQQGWTLSLSEAVAEALEADTAP
jgi:predicted ATPase/DNA-binding SARP family transcriptional activator